MLGVVLQIGVEFQSNYYTYLHYYVDNNNSWIMDLQFVKL